MSLTRPVPAVIAVVPRGQGVLLVRRDNPPDAGLWGFPGGKIEPGETLARATLRELQEETGITASAGPVLAALDAIDRDAAGRLRHHYVLIATLCHWISGTPEAADDVSAAAWVSLSDLRSGAYALSRDVMEIAEQSMQYK